MVTALLASSAATAISVVKSLSLSWVAPSSRRLSRIVESCSLNDWIRPLSSGVSSGSAHVAASVLSSRCRNASSSDGAARRVRPMTVRASASTLRSASFSDVRCRTSRSMHALASWPSAALAMVRSPGSVSAPNRAMRTNTLAATSPPLRGR